MCADWVADKHWIFRPKTFCRRKFQFIETLMTHLFIYLWHIQEVPPLTSILEYGSTPVYLWKSKRLELQNFLALFW